MSQAVKKISIADFLAGHEIRFESLHRCRYKVNGQWVKAQIDFNSGRVIDLSGNILWEGKRLCC